MKSLAEISGINDDFGLFAGMDRIAIAAEMDRDTVPGPLAGRVVGLKANIACAGAPWSAGLEHLADRRAARDANVTGRLRAAGARLMPGLNMDAGALGGTTQNGFFGATHNPRAPDHSAGGSSGGSGAAVATGLVDIALGTDTLGSIRIPASYCGIFGLKPTFGAIGRTGIVPLAESLDCVGPLAAHAADLWLCLKVLAGEDPADPDSRTGPAGWLDAAPQGDVAGLRIGVRADDDTDTTPKVRAAVAAALARLEARGASLVPVTMPGWRAARLRKAAFLLTECEGAQVHAEALAKGDVLPQDMQSLLAYGRDVASDRIVAALAEMRAARMQLERTWAEVDVLATPTTPGTAIPLGQPTPANQADYTALANVAGGPAVAIPLPVTAPGSGGSGDALPASLQIIGPHWSEAALVRIAMSLEDASR